MKCMYMYLVAIGVSECYGEGINEGSPPCLGQDPFKLSTEKGRGGGREGGGRKGEGAEGGERGEREGEEGRERERGRGERGEGKGEKEGGERGGRGREGEGERGEREEGKKETEKERSTREQEKVQCVCWQLQEPHSVSDSDLGDEHVSSQVHHPPVAIIRCRPEAAGLCQQPIHCLPRGMIPIDTAGCG